MEYFISTNIFSLWKIKQIQSNNKNNNTDLNEAPVTKRVYSKTVVTGDVDENSDETFRCKAPLKKSRPTTTVQTLTSSLVALKYNNLLDKRQVKQLEDDVKLEIFILEFE